MSPIPPPPAASTAPCAASTSLTANAMCANPGRFAAVGGHDVDVAKADTGEGQLRQSRVPYRTK